MAGDIIIRISIIRYLGMWMDSSLNFKTHFTKKCQAAMIHFVHIKNIKHFLTAGATKSLLLSLCISHINYCSALSYRLPDVTINKFQRVQNMCAHLVLRTKWESARWCLAKLHWLPVRQHIIFKIAVLSHKLLHKDEPKYLHDLLILKTTNKRLRSSSDTHLLVIPRTKQKTLADRSFSIAALTIWNSLPLDIRLLDNLLIFKHDLKTPHYQQSLINMCT